MGQFEGAQPEKDKASSVPDTQPVVSAPLEHTPGTDVRSSNKDAVAKREADVFGDSFSFAQFGTAEKAAKKATESKAENRDGSAQKPDNRSGAGGTEAKPASGKPEQKGVDGMITGAREYWQNMSDGATKEGGVMGHAEALAADAMGLGVDAFEKGHDLINKVFPDGIIAPARDYWKAMAKEGDTQGGISGNAKMVAGKAMDGLLALSGLGNVEDGVNKVVKDLDDVVPPEQLKHDVAWLGVDTALAAATFIPGITGAKAMAKGGTAFRTAEAGTEIAGMAATKAGLSESVGSKLLTAIKEALPEAGAVTKESIGNFVGKIQKVASEYGIQIKEAGMIGESSGGMNVIQYSSKAGGPHEVAHVLQQVQTRATALESQAARSGKSVAELTQAERATAYETIVKPFEDVAYNQHEMWAGAAHSWGKTSAQYAEVLSNNVKAFESALTTGTVPEALVSAVSKAYGHIPNWLGRSQMEIAKNLGSPVGNTLGHILDSQWKDKDLI